MTRKEIDKIYEDKKVDWNLLWDVCKGDAKQYNKEIIKRRTGGKFLSQQEALDIIYYAMD